MDRSKSGEPFNLAELDKELVLLDGPAGWKQDSKRAGHYNFKNVEIDVWDGKIVFVMVYSSGNLTTARGIKLKDTEDKVIRLYGPPVSVKGTEVRRFLTFGDSNNKVQITISKRGQNNGKVVDIRMWTEEKN